MLHLIIGRLSYALLRESETQTQCAVLIAVADDAEVADFACILHMCPNACADVVVTHTHYAQRVTGICREFPEVNLLGNIVARHELNAYRHILCNDCVYTLLNLCNLLLCRCAGQGIVALALLALDMSITAALAPEHTNHCLVKNMLCGVHRCD